MRISDWSSDVCSSDLYHSRYPLVSGIAADASCTRDAALPGFVGAFVACQGFNAAFNPIGKEPLPVDTATLFLDYPENIQLYGISFNTNIGSWAVSGEYGYRPNQPLQILQSDVLFATLGRSEEHTSEIQSLMRKSYAVYCLKKNNIQNKTTNN